VFCDVTICDITNCNITNFYRENSLAPRPTTDLEDCPLSAVRECLFYTFAATLPIWWPLFVYPQTEDAPCFRGTDLMEKGPSL